MSLWVDYYCFAYEKHNTLRERERDVDWHLWTDTKTQKDFTRKKNDDDDDDDTFFRQNTQRRFISTFPREKAATKDYYK